MKEPEVVIEMRYNEAYSFTLFRDEKGGGWILAIHYYQDTTEYQLDRASMGWLAQHMIKELARL